MSLGTTPSRATLYRRGRARKAKRKVKRSLQDFYDFARSVTKGDDETDDESLDFQPPPFKRRRRRSPTVSERSYGPNIDYDSDSSANDFIDDRSSVDIEEDRMSAPADGDEGVWDSEYTDEFEDEDEDEETEAGSVTATASSREWSGDGVDDENMGEGIIAASDAEDVEDVLDEGTPTYEISFSKTLARGTGSGLKKGGSKHTAQLSHVGRYGSVLKEDDPDDRCQDCW